MPTPRAQQDMGLRGQLAALVAGHGRRIRADDTWLYLEDPAMPTLPHGWKLHVSTRPELLARTVAVVVPILLGYTCDAKFAATTQVLRELNTGRRNPATVGKAVTVYPRTRDVVALGEELARALAGWTGPRIPSDRQVRPDAPVYYRYGPIHAGLPQDADRDLTMAGPDGRSFPGTAHTSYRQPPWAQDPFAAKATSATSAAKPTSATSAATAAAPPPVSTRIGGDRYRITAGIVRAPQGDVYRAVESATGRQLVVKQARAYVAEDAAGVDARGRLRHEHRVLRVLAGIEGVPEAVDYFRHGQDEYLVTTDCGPRDLRRDVLNFGPYEDRPAAGPNTRDWHALAARLSRILDEVHRRGVVLCDLKPDNVVLDPSGACHLVDFGVSSVDGRHSGGWTPGYSLVTAPRSGQPVSPADDLHALGATLYYAISGLDPVRIDRDGAVNRDRTLACLAGVLPEERTHPARALIAGLLSPDHQERTATAGWLLRGGPLPQRRATHPLPRITPGLLDDVTAHAVATCVRQARELIRTREPSGRTPKQLLSLYEGSAGLGLELLHHAERHPQARAAAADLARWTARHPALGLLPPGLYDGRTGVELFLTEAAAPDTPSTVIDIRLPADLDGDQISGAAGVGTGHLLLAERAHAAGQHAAGARYLAVAAQCARGLLEGHFATVAPGRPTADTAALPDGFAHGRAGVAHFLLAHHRASGDEASGHRAEQMIAALAAATPDHLAAAVRPGATRRYGSWCRGLAGLGTVLCQAGRHYGDGALLDLAADAARACLVLAPRMGQVIQCCGLAGTGELMLDLAAAGRAEEFGAAAEQIAALILARSGGDRRAPIFPDGTLGAESASWATGTAGVLSFLRLLHAAGPADWKRGQVTRAPRTLPVGW
ncbi:class IV lanthionine synthetase LanL [Kitasatospora kifunensis]|uniref:non-specific serine/threonine protein kinase n=1 Tax=Kitasatospora kifunensis TaxID=58351 RepID=A0A7W7VZ59_KITKI|nr:class IV lanthionine synthetase LanL [Kitasatospora kifunensis]MBB4927733.1 tRNA A-37 threonylcarbamoyl transferase component Bud32 [Kitasatospora kifunensis]